MHLDGGMDVPHKPSAREVAAHRRGAVLVRVLLLSIFIMSHLRLSIETIQRFNWAKLAKLHLVDVPHKPRAREVAAHRRGANPVKVLLFSIFVMPPLRHREGADPARILIRFFIKAPSLWRWHVCEHGLNTPRN